MTKEELIKNLKYTMEKHKNDNVDTFGTNISLMCKDVLDYLEQQPSEDCVSRQAAKIDVIPNSLYTSEQVIALLDNLPPVTPTHCFAEVRFSKEELREICKERIEIECTHGTCKDCTKSKILNDFKGHSIVCSRFGRMAVNPDFYCADFEKRGSEK